MKPEPWYHESEFSPGHHLCPGNLIDFDVRGKYAHQLCGEHQIRGAFCPSCDKPLILHALLDTADPSLNLGFFGVKRLPLLYCMRCMAHQDAFAYVFESDDSIRISYFGRGFCEGSNPKSNTKEWDEHVGKESFPCRDISLTPIVPRLQELYDQINLQRNYNAEQNREGGILTRNYAPEEVGGHPYLGAVNQVGGRPFLQRWFGDPYCPMCWLKGKKSQSYFVAALDNISEHNFEITYDGLLVCFFTCVKCRAIICDNAVH